MITTVTIEQLCIREEAHEGRRQDRVAEIHALLDARDREAMEVEVRDLLGARWIDCPQLACEALKWHSLRMDGRGLHEALDQMVGPAFA